MNIWDTGSLLLKLISPAMYETKICSDLMKARDKYREHMSTIIPLKHEFDILKEISNENTIQKINEQLSSARIMAKLLEARLAQEIEIRKKLQQLLKQHSRDKTFAQSIFYKERQQVTELSDIAHPMHIAQELVNQAKNQAHITNNDDLLRINNIMDYMKGFNKGLFMIRDIILKEKELNRIILDKILRFV